MLVLLVQHGSAGQLCISLPLGGLYGWRFTHPWWEEHVSSCSQTLELPHCRQEHDTDAHTTGQSKSVVHDQLEKNWERAALLSSVRQRLQIFGKELCCLSQIWG